MQFGLFFLHWLIGYSPARHRGNMIRSLSSLCEICDGHIGTGTHFNQGNSNFPCYYHPTNSP